MKGVNYLSNTRYEWELGPCVPSHKYKAGSDIFSEKCCVPIGNYVLSCRNNDELGWLLNNFVKVGRHQFCDEYVGYNALSAINIPGMNLRNISTSWCELFSFVIWL